MTAREFNSHADVDVARLVVLGALSRGMSFSYAARTAAVSTDQVRELAEAAGWPDIELVKGEHAALREALNKPVRKRVAPPPRPTVPIPPRPKPAVTAEPILAGDIRSHANPHGLGDVPETISQAEQEYRGEVVQAGPTPEHREPLEAYVARVVEPIETRLTGELELPPGVRVQFDTTPLEFGGIPMVADQEVPPGVVLVKDGDEVVATINVEQLREQLFDVHQLDLARAIPPATDSPAPKPRQLPCEVCGVGVLTSYVEKTGRQRHGHHPEGS